LQNSGAGSPSDTAVYVGRHPNSGELRRLDKDQYELGAVSTAVMLLPMTCRGSSTMMTASDAIVPASSFTGGWSVRMRSGRYIVVDPTSEEVAATHGLDTATYFIADQLSIARARASASYSGDRATRRATTTEAASGLPTGFAHRLD
jgi:hypothetical protein